MSEPVYAAVDLGGTKVACALASESGRLLAERSEPTHSEEGPDAVLGRIAGLVNALAAEVGARPAALGMGVPGLADLQAGSTLFLPNLPTQWRGVPVRDKLSGPARCPVFLLNDVRMATLGELVYGHGREVGTMAFFALGTGIGGGIVIDGKLRLGPLGAAGELGHQTIIADGPRCGCGNHGCLEALASGPAIAAEGVRLLQSGQAPHLQEITQGNLEAVSPGSMAAAAEAGDEAVREALQRAGQYIGIGVANIVTALHPELVVLGGGVAEVGALLVDTVRRTMQERVRMFPTGGVRVERSVLGAKAGLWGGIALAARSGRV